MASLEVDIATFTDADFNLVQTQPWANGLASLPASVNPFVLHMQIRASATDPTVWADSANVLIPMDPQNPPLSVVGVASGTTITIYIPQRILKTMPPGQYVYSVIMSSFSGQQRTELFRGIITHSAGPTTWAAGTL